MSVLTLHFKEPVLSETGEDTGKVKSMNILGVFVEGSALVAGLSEEVTAIIPLAEISWASVYEGAESGSDTEGAAGEGESDDGAAEGEGSASILKPDFTGGGGAS
jgi:hypothetical protein